ncbi:MAG: hypothetical protein DI543_15695 [Bradyrhizobium icense]|jgi:hypothetical protein|nr:MAG: hypothetical protein DI543_15695 [Bradyrhizobium icense]
MLDEYDGDKPTRTKPDAPAQQDSVSEEDHDPEAHKSPLTGMLGMHIDQPDNDASSGSPGADIDRNLGEKE